MKKIIPVPYISQHSNNFEKSWQDGSCGIACVAMLLGYYNLEDIPPMSLVKEGATIDGYLDTKGWFHHALVRLLRNHGVNAYAQEFRSVEVDSRTKNFVISPHEEKMIESGLTKIIHEINAEHPVVISVNAKFNLNNNNHLILVIGYDFTEGNEKLIIHDPDGRNHNQSHEELSVDITKIRQFWRKFAIFSYI